MKLSVEAKVAAAVAAGLMVLTSGAMAQGRKGQTAGPNHSSVANTHMSQQGNNGSLFGRTNAEENTPTVSDEKVTSSGRQQREARRDARDQREARHDAREQREARRDAREQRQDRHQQGEQQPTKSTKEKSPFDGSMLDVKPPSM